MAAAQIAPCAVGTIKSRVARARETLLEMLEGRQPMPEAREGDTDEVRVEDFPLGRHSLTRRLPAQSQFSL